jgi:glycosyltransferase involved in cell wall biosynthesis
MMREDGVLPLRLSLTNVTGLGATQLVQSLLPALERAGPVGDIHLPAQGVLASYSRQSPGPAPRSINRRLPNAISRLFECTLGAAAFDGVQPLLVLGDLPLRIHGPQIVFVHTPHLLLEPAGASRSQRIKFAIARILFRANASRIDAAIVQTDTMRRGLETAYPTLAGRVHVIAQPAPEWLLDADLQRTGRTTADQKRLRLFYPAAGYPHKNHALLRVAAERSDWQHLVDTLVVTVPADAAPSPGIETVGRLGPTAMREEYARADALVFPSLAESYGLPLVEAMAIGLPILCADLPYARDLCGNEAIYFMPHDPAALTAAVAELDRRLTRNWWPDWTPQLKLIPNNWDDVAQRMTTITQHIR